MKIHKKVKKIGKKRIKIAVKSMKKQSMKKYYYVLAKDIEKWKKMVY